MVDAAGIFICLFIPHNIQQCFRLFLSLIGTFRLICIFRDIPCLANTESTSYSSLRTVIPYTALRHIPFFCYFSNRKVSHQLSSVINQIYIYTLLRYTISYYRQVLQVIYVLLFHFLPLNLYKMQRCDIIQYYTLIFLQKRHPNRVSDSLGASEGNRTPNLLITNELLYH